MQKLFFFFFIQPVILCVAEMSSKQPAPTLWFHYMCIALSLGRPSLIYASDEKEKSVGEIVNNEQILVDIETGWQLLIENVIVTLNTFRKRRPEMEKLVWPLAPLRK